MRGLGQSVRELTLGKPQAFPGDDHKKEHRFRPSRQLSIAMNAALGPEPSIELRFVTLLTAKKTHSPPWAMGPLSRRDPAIPVRGVSSFYATSPQPWRLTS